MNSFCYYYYNYILIYLIRNNYVLLCFKIINYNGSIFTPAILSTTGATNGCDNNGPIIGIDLKNWTTTPKKSPNNPNIPIVSMMNPVNVHLERIIKTPRVKQMEPRLLLGLVKKTTVFLGPMINMTPLKNKMLPNANNARSKRVNTPRMKQRNPAKVNTTPNSANKNWLN